MKVTAIETDQISSPLHRLGYPLDQPFERWGLSEEVFLQLRAHFSKRSIRGFVFTPEELSKDEVRAAFLLLV